MSQAIVVMGVSGCGKSTLAAGIARKLGWAFVEGDDCHPAANVAKMARGIPLDDMDRHPFLCAVADRLAAAPTGAVAACSALKRSYRDMLRARADTTLLFVLPQLSRDILLARVGRRSNHFMPTSLLDSQLATLEPPAHDEAAVVLDGTDPIERQIAAVVAAVNS